MIPPVSCPASLPFDSFLLLRHGETAFNRRELTLGRLDPPLTSEGRRQAEHAAAGLAGIAVSGIYASPALRCRDTAACAAAVLGMVPRVLPDLIERCWGELEGRPRALKAIRPLPASVEPAGMFEARVQRALAAVSGPLPLLVTHSGVFRALATRLGVPPPHAVPTGGLARFTHAGDGIWRLDITPAMLVANGR